MARAKQTKASVQKKTPSVVPGDFGPPQPQPKVVGRGRWPAPPGVAKPHPYRLGTVALREIRRYQKSTERLVPKAPFKRLVHAIIGEVAPPTAGSTGYRIGDCAIDALQEAFEETAVRLFNLTNKVACQRGMPTIQKKDLDFAAELMGLSKK